MAKSMRSKREKRLRAIRREIVSADPITQKKEGAKLVTQEAALKLPVCSQSTTSGTIAMAIELTATTSNDKDSNMEHPQHGSMTKAKSVDQGDEKSATSMKLEMQGSTEGVLIGTQNMACTPEKGGKMFLSWKNISYLRNRLEFRHIHCYPVPQVVHPMHDQAFYLTNEHKKRLKEEYGGHRRRRGSKICCS